ncbi:MAG: hypothetical protein EXR72_02830 [Myxococcales bacterium]|nr:hypothetical protein [Myxococcales bacterium]
MLITIMPKLTIEKKHALPADVVRQRLDALNARLAEKYGIAAVWKSSTEATFKRTGASGTISCRDDRVVIHLDLSFVLSGLRERIENRIRRELESALAEPAAEA